GEWLRLACGSLSPFRLRGVRPLRSTTRGVAVLNDLRAQQRGSLSEGAERRRRNGLSEERQRESKPPLRRGTSDEDLSCPGCRYPLETGDVGTGDVVTADAVFLRRGERRLVDVAHDLAQLVLAVVERPPLAGGVLAHLQSRGRNATGVRGLTGSEQDPCALE